MARFEILKLSHVPLDLVQRDDRKIERKGIYLSVVFKKCNEMCPNLNLFINFEFLLLNSKVCLDQRTDC